jgi:hypothetical protein
MLALRDSISTDYRMVGEGVFKPRRGLWYGFYFRIHAKNAESL